MSNLRYIEGNAICPNVTFSNITLEGDLDTDGNPSNLIVTIDAAMQEQDTGGLYGGLLDETSPYFEGALNFSQYLKVRVIEITSKTIMDQIMGELTNPDAFRMTPPTIGTVIHADLTPPAPYSDVSLLQEEDGIRIKTLSYNDIILARDRGIPAGNPWPTEGGDRDEPVQTIVQNLYTHGGEFTLPNGAPYVGPYHIHPERGAMAGPEHTETPHSNLIPAGRMADRTTTRNIPFHVQYNFDQEELPMFLSYIVFAYYDFDNLGQMFSLPVHMRKMFGTAYIQPVIGQDGTVEDRKIQDYREARQAFTGRRIDYSLLSEEYRAIADPVALASNKQLKEMIPDSSYFTDFYVSRDNLGRARFLFGLDYRGLIENETQYGKLILSNSENVNKPTAQLMKKIKLLSFRMLRRRVHPRLRDNRIGSPALGNTLFTSSEPEKVIFHTKGHNARQQDSLDGIPVLHRGSRRARRNSTDAFVVDVKKTLESQRYQYIRHYSGVDVSVANETFGHFQYGVELEFEDSTSDFLFRRHNRLIAARRNVNEYINILNIPDIFKLDPAGKFVTADLVRFRRNLVIPAIDTYIRVVRALTDVKERRVRKFKKLIRKTTNPYTLSARGVMEFSRLLDELISNIEEITGATGTSIRNPYIPGSTGTIGGSRKSPRTFKIRTYFPDLFNSDIDKGVGYEYLSLAQTPDEVVSADSRGTFSGLKRINLADFEARFGLEHSKYFNSRSGIEPLKINLGGRRRSLITSMGEAQIHLSPSVARVGDMTHFFTQQDIDMWNQDNNSNLAAKILSYKATGRVPTALKESQNAEEIGGFRLDLSYVNTLSDVFASAAAAAFPTSARVTMINEGGKNLSNAETAAAEDIIDATIWDGESDDTEIEDDREEAQRYVIRDPRTVKFMTFLGSKMSINSDVSEIRTKKQRAQDDKRFNINVLNPSTPDSVFSNENNRRKIRRLIRTLPIQLKSIVADAAFAGFERTVGQASNVKYDFSSMTRDPLSDPKYLNGFIFNYLLLQRVEYLAGYETTRGANKVLLREPIWRPLRVATLRQLVYDDIRVICRLRRFDDSIVPSVREGESLDLPSYNEYFIVERGRRGRTDSRISDSATNEAGSQETDATFSEELEDFDEGFYTTVLNN